VSDPTVSYAPQVVQGWVVKLVKASKLKTGNRLFIDGFLPEMVEVSSSAHQEQSVLILFLNGKIRIDENFRVLENQEGLFSEQ
jgi:hypothetical protein